MNFIKIEQMDTANGVGIGTVLWVSGCNHQCPCCHNPQTWDKNAGKLWELRHTDFLLETLKPDYITRLTLSGGDPLFPENRHEVLKVCMAVKTIIPEKVIWLYTGYKWEEIKEITWLSQFVDVVVDEPFKIQMKDLNLPYRGSSNQHIIPLTDMGAKILQGIK